MNFPKLWAACLIFISTHAFAHNQTKTKIELLCDEARKWHGTLEEGNNSGAVVEKFQKAVDGQALGEPWCMCFVQFCIKEAESEYARVYPQETLKVSDICRSEHCLHTWNNSRGLQQTTPRAGDVCVWQKFHGDVGTPNGHAGIVVEVSEDGKRIITVEGNTMPEQDDRIESNGSGVYIKHRKVNRLSNKAFKCKGFLRVWS
jgi:hypothetical protein